MVQELGRIERPSAEQYQGKRKLLLLPLVYEPPTEAQEGLAILQRYWEQVRLQIASLESRLGQIRHIYHESLTEGGSQGLEYLQKVDQRSHTLVETRCQAGAVLEATESDDFLAEVVDLQRCLMMPLTSGKVARRLHEWFSESNRNRYEHIAKQISTTLGQNEVGLLLISERHQVQFPEDIEVFYIAPPALEDFRHWLRDWVTQQQQPAGETKGDEQTLSQPP